MIKVYGHGDPFMIQQVRNMLDMRDVPYLVKNSFLSGAMGELPPHELEQEIWLMDDEWFAKVQAWLNEMEGAPSLHADWCCSSCQETNGSAFESCWRCGYSPVDDEEVAAQV